MPASQINSNNIQKFKLNFYNKKMNEENKIQFGSGFKNQKNLSVRFSHDFKGIEVFCLKFCPDDELLASGYSDGSLRVISVSNQKVLYKQNGCIVDQGSAITSLRWRPNKHISTKQVLVTVNSDGSIIHWYAQKGKILHQMYEPQNSIMCMDYNLDGSRLATSGKDFNVRVYDEDMKAVSVLFPSASWKQSGHNNRVFSIKFVHDNPNILMSGGWDSNLIIWDMRVGESVGSLFGPNLSGDSIDYKDGQVITGSYRSKDQVQLWDLGKRKVINTIKWPDSEHAYIYTCQFSKTPGNKDIMVGSVGQNEVRLFEEKNSYQTCGLIQGVKDGIYSVDSGNKSKFFAFGGGNGSVSVIDIG